MNQEVLDYLAAQPARQRELLQQMHDLAISAIPNTESIISYGIIGFRYQNKVPFFISGWRNHVSIHGGRALGERAKKIIPDLKVVGTTIQIALDRPLSEDQLRAIIATRLEIFDESGGKL